MSRSLMRILIIIGGAVGLLALVAMTVLLFVDINRFKPRFEAAASGALGMDVRVGGRLGMNLFRGFHLTVEDARVLDKQGETVASAKRAGFWIELLPLLRRKLRLNRIELTEPTLSIEREPGGDLDVEGLKTAAALLAALDGASVSLADGKLRYGYRASGDAIEATGLDLSVDRLRFAGRSGPQSWKDLSFKAELACGAVRSRNLLISDLKAGLAGKNGVFQLEPVTMHLFGGQMTGSVRADASGPFPRYQVHGSLMRFRIEEFLKTLSPDRAAEGAMDFTASLSMEGKSPGELAQTAMGEMSLRGENLMLVGNDLDRTIARFESSQGFNLVDVGALFFAGPVGLAVTKGYNYASLFRGSGGTSRIGVLVSDWRVDRGVAQTRDVAMATARNRIALRGGLDFVNERFVDLTAAVIDTKGCARVRQVIRGPFGTPVVEKPRVLMSLAGPVLKLYRQTRGLFPAEPCEAFYSGSVAPPR